jgi:hypothetical protein
VIGKRSKSRGIVPGYEKDRQNGIALANIAADSQQIQDRAVYVPTAEDIDQACERFSKMLKKRPDLLPAANAFFAYLVTHKT